MGMAADPMAVVDSHAKVFGVGGLRVADASVFPVPACGHPQSMMCKSTSRVMLDTEPAQRFSSTG